MAQIYEIFCGSLAATAYCSAASCDAAEQFIRRMAYDYGLDRHVTIQPCADVPPNAHKMLAGFSAAGGAVDRYVKKFGGAA